ncbi:hypothetical protein, partial [Hominenteromicrobium sp.]|uniref:hypothetical protein n=1 Tax=Hominenteromicrobium sp. TaxID=3073581 RepID=UPI003A8CF245
ISFGASLSIGTLRPRSIKAYDIPARPCGFSFPALRGGEPVDNDLEPEHGPHDRPDQHRKAEQLD